MIFCKKYRCSITPEFCARRYQKALDNPQDDSLLLCRECDYGNCMYNNRAPAPVNKIYKKYTEKKTHPCPQCGLETREKLCAKCKVEKAEPGAKEARSSKLLLGRPGSHKPDKTGSIPAIAPKGSGSHLLGQMLYSSDLLDKQVNKAIETGMIDTKVILDIRFRLREVLRDRGGL